MTFEIVRTDSDLAHHGIKGQKWGVRRYQNKNGSLTDEGKLRRKGSLFEEPVYYKGVLMSRSKAEKLKAKDEKKPKKEPSEIDKKFSAFMNKVSDKIPKPVAELADFRQHMAYYYNRYVLPVDLPLTVVDVATRLKK